MQHIRRTHTRSALALASPVPIPRYSLQNLQNNYYVEEWPIYRDFKHVCVRGDCDKVNEFYESNVRDYEAFLRRESPSLTFYDPAWDCTHTLDFDIRKKLVTSVFRYAITRNISSPILAWFAGRREDIDESQLVYILYSLCVTRNVEQAACMLQHFPRAPLRAPGVDVVAAARETNDPTLIRLMGAATQLQ